MAVSVGGSAETPMSDINTTPLVDVMLVLLIIFLIAVPVAIKSIEDLEVPIIKSVESKDKEARYFHIHERDQLDEAQIATWVKQAAALPGWVP
jgi:biopolymer transport protein ExbD